VPRVGNNIIDKELQAKICNARNRETRKRSVKPWSKNENSLPMCNEGSRLGMEDGETHEGWKGNDIYLGAKECSMGGQLGYQDQARLAIPRLRRMCRKV